MSDLTEKRCLPCEGGVAALSAERIQELLKSLPAWQVCGHEIVREFHFKNFYQSMAFANAVAWIADQENHHPDMTVTYTQCIVKYSTHSIGGLTENDFICAAKIDRLLDVEASGSCQLGY